MNNQNAIRNLSLSAMIAALYAVLTMALPVLSYGAVQLRFAEALTVLPFLFPQGLAPRRQQQRLKQQRSLVSAPGAPAC